MCKTHYEEAKERWGNTAAWQEFEKRSDTSKETGGGLMKLFARLGELKELPPESRDAQAAVSDIQLYITGHYYTLAPTRSSPGSARCMSPMSGSERISTKPAATAQRNSPM